MIRRILWNRVQIEIVSIIMIYLYGDVDHYIGKDEHFKSSLTAKDDDLDKRTELSVLSNLNIGIRSMREHQKGLLLTGNSNGHQSSNYYKSLSMDEA